MEEVKKTHIIGMMPTYNALTQGYPFVEAIYSSLQYCDKLYIVDGSDDGTEKILSKISQNGSIKVIYKKWPISRFNTKGGKVIADISNSLLNIVKDNESPEDYVFYIQANEIAHECAYGFLRSLRGAYPGYIGFYLPYYEMYGRYLFGEQYRLRVMKIRNSEVADDGWTLRPIGDATVRGLFLMTRRLLYSLLIRRSVNFFSERDLKYLFPPYPIFHYSRIFPIMTIRKLRMHANLFKKWYFGKAEFLNNLGVMEEDALTLSSDEFFERLCVIESNEYLKMRFRPRMRKEFWNYKVVKCKFVSSDYHPAVVKGALDEREYRINERLLMEIVKKD
ncbi:MAG: hypothetical protein QXU18_12330 [Thermoplasmatales archaeon]